jgi:enoyl-CoA hydratase/carnithine racemase
MPKTINNQYYDASIQSKLAIINFKADVFDFLSNLNESQVLIDFIKESEYDKQVKGVLLLHQPGCLGAEAYEGFLRKIAKTNENIDEMEIQPIAEKVIRFREINILSKFIKFLGNYQKLVIASMSSELVTPFIGIALVADFRLASPNASFSMHHRKFGLHPSGGIPFFLERLLGRSKAIELQFTENIGAEKAYKLGLIDQILPEENFNSHCIRYMQPFLNECPSTLRLTKRLNNYSNSQLIDYFDYEAGLLNL